MSIVKLQNAHKELLKHNCLTEHFTFQFSALNIFLFLFFQLVKYLLHSFFFLFKATLMSCLTTTLGWLNLILNVCMSLANFCCAGSHFVMLYWLTY